MINLDPYLASTRHVDLEDPALRHLLEERGLHALSPIDAAKAAFEYVRDEVPHAWDIRSHDVARTASDVLRLGNGLCYAKSMLLTAMLRSLSIPSGFAYQRLRFDDTEESGFCAHGFTTVFLEGRWHRVDARGNTNGIDARFSLDESVLAFPIRPELGEWEASENHAEPLPNVIEALDAHEDLHVLILELPDLERV